MRFIITCYLLFVMSLTYSQTRRVYGLVIDTAFGDKFIPVTICIYDTAQKTGFKDCTRTNKKGKFDITLPPDFSASPYKMRFITIGRSTKELLVYDTTRLPLKITLEDLYVPKPGPDLRIYDPSVKLLKHKNQEIEGHDTTLADAKLYTLEYLKKVQELTLYYNESCGEDLDPVAKLFSDTLFIMSKKNGLDVLNYSLCHYKRTFQITGLKPKKYTVIFREEVFEEKK